MSCFAQTKTIVIGGETFFLVSQSERISLIQSAQDAKDLEAYSYLLEDELTIRDSLEAGLYKENNQLSVAVVSLFDLVDTQDEQLLAKDFSINLLEDQSDLWKKKARQRPIIWGLTGGLIGAGISIAF